MKVEYAQTTCSLFDPFSFVQVNLQPPVRMSKRPHDALETEEEAAADEKLVKKHTLDSDEEDEVDHKKYNLMDPEEIEGNNYPFCAKLIRFNGPNVAKDVRQPSW